VAEDDPSRLSIEKAPDASLGREVPPRSSPEANPPKEDIAAARPDAFGVNVTLMQGISAELAAVEHAKCAAQVQVAATNLEAARADAAARERVAELTHAVPAREQTKRDREDTRRLRFAGLMFVVCVIAICVRPGAATAIATAFAVLGGGLAIPSIIDRARKKPPGDSGKPE
jgi:hypothetical protein